MEYDLDEPFEVRLIEDNNPDRPHFYIYSGLLDSLLFNADEKMFIIYLIGSAEDSGVDRINTISASIDRLSQKMRIDRSSVCKNIRSLKEKGVLIKKDISAENSTDPICAYGVLNYVSVWDCKTFDELKKETDRIKLEVKYDV